MNPEFNNKVPEQKHILLVEDNKDNIELALEILTEEGYRVGVARNGLEALEYIEKNQKPDLILLDIAMPEMDGFQTCIQLKGNENTSDIPIIYLSALNESASIVKGFELGAVDYVLKPFSFYELLSRVRTHIELKESREKLLSVNNYLEKVVEERTHELRHAYERLEHLDKAKTEFLSLISHELRTPLNGIIGYFSLFKEMVDQPAAIDDQFKNSVDDLIKKLLRFSDLSILFTELRSSYYASKNEDVVINASIESVMEPLKPLADAKKLDVVNTIEDGEILIADRYLFNNCLDIVLDNAIKFSPERGEVKISCFYADGFKTMVITDDGPGFTDKARNYLFDLFETDNFSNAYSGFGLGMATLKLIMDTFEGRVEIGNKSEKGAIIKLSFKSIN
jgi:two-component system, sensor histidine kinase and response regulator